MAPDRTDSDPILTSLLAKAAAWQAAVDSYKAARAMEQGGNSDGATGGVSRGAIELPVNAFRGMTMNEAIKLFLKSVQRKQTGAEIAEGLKNGGLVSTAKDIGPTLRSALNKLKGEGVLLRFSDGWDLAEAHSAMIRHRVTKENAHHVKPAKKRGGGRKPKVAAKSKPIAALASRPRAGEAQTLDERAQLFLQAHALEGFTVKQIADVLGLPDASKLVLSLSRLVRYKKAVKSADGRYSILRAA